MKKITFLGALLLSIAAMPQDISLVSQSGNTIVLSNASGSFVSQTTSINGKKHEDFSKSAKVLTMQAGQPAVPVFSKSVILPDTGAAALVIEHDGYDEFDNIEVLPSKGSLKRNINPADVPYSFGTAYTQDAFYPGELASLSSPYIIRDVRGATVSFMPYQYNPVTKKLRLYKNIRASVEVNLQAEGINEKRTTKAAPVAAFNQMYQKLFANFENENEIPENGEMLIIAPPAYINTIAPLAQWKLHKGIRTVMVPLSDVGATPETIKAYIQNFYSNNPGLAYVLLVGDHQQLPSYSYGITGAFEELWSDSYYGQLSGSDYYPEVLVGRFSGTVSQVSVMVNRTLEYEKTPAQGDWMTKMAAIASDEGYGYGDDGQADWEHLRAIGEQLLNVGYTHIYEFYEGSKGGNDADGWPQAYMISDAVNEGVGLLNYTGHGAENVFSTGNFTNNDVNALQNNGKYPFIISVACNNGTFTNGTSLCEAWLNAASGGMSTGAIAAAGSSILMAWAEPMQTQDGMTDLVADNAKATLGGLFYNGQVTMLDAYALSGTAIEVMQTWVFFGDPSVDYRKALTQQLTASHEAVIPEDATTITISCDTEGALVVLTQDGIIVGTGIVEGGQVVIVLEDFDPSKPMTVTATQQNYAPYQGTVTTGALNNSSFSIANSTVYPNPAKDFVTIHPGNTIEAAYELRDVTGKLVYTSGTTDAGSYTINTSGYSSGVYFLTISSGNARAVRKVVIE